MFLFGLCPKSLENKDLKYTLKETEMDATLTAK